MENKHSSFILKAHSFINLSLTSGSGKLSIDAINVILEELRLKGEIFASCLNQFSSARFTFFQMVLAFSITSQCSSNG